MSAPRLHTSAEPITLRGMTWSDPRGYDPVVAAAEAFMRANPGVTITWDKRSLQGFESTPVDELAAAYDLMVIDHPHTGICVAEGCLLPLDAWLPPEVLQALANETVGKSYVSYTLQGHQWALPIDAATQVQAHRPDKGARAATWAEVIAAAQAGEVILPLRPPHGLMCLYTLAANIGQPCGSARDELLPRATGLAVFEALLAVSRHLDPACFGMDPIAALDALCEETGRLRLAPLTYLYKGYANAGYRAKPVAFTDIPTLGQSGPIGSALGGTGIAVSHRCTHPALAAGFAGWLAGAECQRGLYAQANGQPGNAVAWADAEVNAPVKGAYFDTRATHESAWLRPRHAGYMGFQEDGGTIVTEALQGKIAPEAALDALNARFAASFPID
ncbi:extracellular solute-binding protein [Pseudoruegeria sp. SHC-113]|uniref:extracellular solute-binding protein n=1 Tax=Pseudoruegeria sp. SHC-113 TaxID=2855439 RepID=UPI0021BA9DAA|nr:extracellular solute-binding protein [Pseudoruegeria sp. SHC-113]MCT8161307.1 extracellular solute-binding protein [Pseudoruegeria sp. SHC-113]